MTSSTVPLLIRFISLHQIRKSSFSIGPALKTLPSEKSTSIKVPNKLVLDLVWLESPGISILYEYRLGSVQLKSGLGWSFWTVMTFSKLFARDTWL